jgi:hypothetical protein
MAFINLLDTFPKTTPPACGLLFFFFSSARAWGRAGGFAQAALAADEIQVDW